MTKTRHSGGDQPSIDPVSDRSSGDSSRHGSGKSGPGSFVTSRPVAVLMIFLAAVTFGALSYQRLPVTLMPELSYPTLTVRTEYPGAAPEEVENDISRRIEESLGTIGGLRRMSSTSRAGISDVVLEFSWDTEMSDAIQDTLEKLDLVRLPQEAERPLILRFDPSLDPVLELSLSGEGDRFAGEEGLRRLRRLAELQVKRALEPIKGVAAVRVRGGLEEEIHVLLDAEALKRTRLSAQQVITRLGQENINVAGGTLTEGRTEFMVRTVNEYTNLEQIRNTVVASLDGREVRVRDLARVERSHRDRQIATHAGGLDSVQLDVYKEADANMVSLAKSVRAAVGEIEDEAKEEAARSSGGTSSREQDDEAELSRARRQIFAGSLAKRLMREEGVRLEVVADRSVFIEQSINEVRNTAILGGLLAVLVLYLFLRNLVSTLFVAVSIPISLLMTFAPMSTFGVSLNIMSLGGLALGVGMLVDSSIVVLESIFRCREEGDGHVESARRGAVEVRSAVVASIFTSIAVFFPMVFVEGIAGQAFGDLGVAVVVSLLASLAVAMLFIPMLASRGSWNPGEQARLVPRLRTYSSLRQLRGDAGRVRTWIGEQAWRWVPGVLAFAFVAVRFLVSSVLELIGKTVIGVVLVIAFVARRALAPVIVRLFRLLTLGPLAVTERALRFIQGIYEPLLRRALAWPAAVLLVMLTTLLGAGWILQQLDTELLPEVRQGEFTIEVALPVGTPLEETERILAPVERSIVAEQADIESVLVTYGYDPTTAQRSDEGEHTARFKVLLSAGARDREDALVARLRSRFAQVPDLDARVTRPVLFSFKNPIEVEVHGEDLDALRVKAAEVEGVMSAMPELADVETTLKRGAPEIQISYDRDLLARYGLNIAEVAQMVRNQVKGAEATLFNLRDRRVPIVVQLGEMDRASVDQLESLVVNPRDELPIKLAAVADVSLGEGPSEVRRVDGRRVALVQANLGEASLSRAVERIDEVLSAEVVWPDDMTFLVAGQSQEWERSSNSLWLALALSVFLVYVIMAAQFESLLHPLVIMFTIPLAFFGTVLTLWLLGVNLSIVVFLGMIMLAGIVVNNAIVLVDYINRLKARGLERVEAIVTAGRVRLRPILMTTLTTALGLLPMALGLGEGAEIRTPMALAVIGGLVTSTGLTLLIIPVIYLLVDSLQARLLGGQTATTEAPTGRAASGAVEAADSGVVGAPSTAR